MNPELCSLLLQMLYNPSPLIPLNSQKYHIKLILCFVVVVVGLNISAYFLSCKRSPQVKNIGLIERFLFLLQCHKHLASIQVCLTVPALMLVF